MQSIKDQTLILLDNELTETKKRVTKNFNSAYEGYFLLECKLDDLRNCIKIDCDNSTIQKQAVNLAVTAIRFIQELTDIDDAAKFQLDRENLQLLIREYEEKVSLAVIKIFEISDVELRSKSRNEWNVMARVVYSALMRKNGISKSKIGDYLNRDHTTVINSLNSHNDWMQMRGEYKALYLKTELAL